MILVQNSGFRHDIIMNVFCVFLAYSHSSPSHFKKNPQIFHLIISYKDYKIDWGDIYDSKNDRNLLG